MGECTSGEPGGGGPVGAAARTGKQWWPESDGLLATGSHRAIQLAREAACRAGRTSSRPSSTDQPRRHSAKARAHRPTARRRRPRRSVSALVQSEAARSEGRSTPARACPRPDRARRCSNIPTKCESTNTSNATGTGLYTLVGPQSRWVGCVRAGGSASATTTFLATGSSATDRYRAVEDAAALVSARRGGPLGGGPVYVISCPDLMSVCSRCRSGPAPCWMSGRRLERWLPRRRRWSVASTCWSQSNAG
jgi:hypothetical protein